MSHEIRTPLNGVLGVAEILARRLRQPELTPYVQTILSSGETLLRLLTDALDFSRADAGSLASIGSPGVGGSTPGSAIWSVRESALAKST